MATQEVKKIEINTFDEFKNACEIIESPLNVIIIRCAFNNEFEVETKFCETDMIKCSIEENLITIDYDKLGKIMKILIKIPILCRFLFGITQDYILDIGENKNELIEMFYEFPPFLIVYYNKYFENKDIYYGVIVFTVPFSAVRFEVSYDEMHEYSRSYSRYFAIYRSAVYKIMNWKINFYKRIFSKIIKDYEYMPEIGARYFEAKNDFYLCKLNRQT